MSVQNALFTGISGLTTYSNVISVIGNNIANANTTGFKESRANFSDLLSQSLGSLNNVEAGRGVRTNSVDKLFTQGGFQSTSVATDLAIDGDGFFVVKDPATDGVFYTRTGDFRRDASGNLVNSQGLVLQGFDLSQVSTPAAGTVGDINISNQTFPSTATTLATLNLNLNANATSPGVAFDPNNAIATSNFSTAISLFDSLGNSHSAEVYFQKQAAANTWNWFVVSDTGDLTGSGVPASGAVTLASGDMTFTSGGALDTLRTLQRIDYSSGAAAAVSPTEQGANVVFDFGGGASTGQNVTFDFGTPQQLWNGTSFSANPSAPNGSSGTTQFGDNSAILFQSQDGFGPGVLDSFNIDDQGIVRGVFSNAQAIDLFQLQLARFPSPDGLQQVDGGLYVETDVSGTPVLGAPNTSGLGRIVPSALELSNVDLTTQFVELIRAQQAYQANARIITTSDELLAEVVNLRR